MSYSVMKWTLFTMLLLIAPALLFLVQAFMVIPAIFFAAGMIYMVPKAVITAHMMETLAFIGIFGAHLLIFAGIYILIAMACAKLLSRIRNPKVRNIAFAVLCLGVVSVALFPVYGSGGHGPASWGSLLYAFQQVDSEYGPYTAVMVYGVALLCGAAVVLYRKHRRGRIAADRRQRPQ